MDCHALRARNDDGEKMNYSNTNEHLYNDIALWEKTDGRDLFLEMPLTEKNSPAVLDFGYGFGENLFVRPARRQARLPHSRSLLLPGRER